MRYSNILMCLSLFIIGGQSSAQDPSPLGAFQARCDQAALDPDYTILDQACDAMPELGIFAQFSCLDGEIIPITIDDQEPLPQGVSPGA